MADVFVSYAKADRASAERVVSTLQAAGRSVWWDDELTPHGSWDATIERELNAARAVLVLWTPTSVASDFVRAEANWAKGQGKLVPVMLQPCTLPIAFSMVQTAALDGWEGEAGHAAWQRVLRWLDTAGEPAAMAPSTRGDVAAGRPRTAARTSPVRLALTGVMAVGVLAAAAWFALAGRDPAPVWVEALDAGAPGCGLRDARAFADPAVPDACFRCPADMTRTRAAVTGPEACSKPGGNGSFPAVKIGDAAPGIGNCPGGFRDATIRGCWSCQGGSRKVFPNLPKVTDPDACHGERPRVTAAAQSLGPPACPEDAFRLPGQARCMACPPGSAKTDDGRCRAAPGQST